MRMRGLFQAGALLLLLMWLGLAAAHPGHHDELAPASANTAAQAIARAELTAASTAPVLSPSDPCPDPASGCCCSAHRCSGQPTPQPFVPAPELALRVASRD